MPIVDPEIISEGRGFSVGFCAFGLTLGLLIWVTGWRAHRFWIVLGATVIAGVVGMAKAPFLNVQPLVGGVLLALAAGLLALALVRVIAFAAGGGAAWLAVRHFAPTTWHEPLVCFLAGGLAGLLLFRLWIMLLTGMVGALGMVYFALWFADRLGRWDAVTLASQQSVLLNWIWGVIAALGMIVQLVIDRRVIGRLRDEAEYGRMYRGGRRRHEQRPWWRLGSEPFRRAG
jgi:hypothetical protein